MNIKSQSLSINTIIIAALALVVLAVLIFIFTNSNKKITENIGSCLTKGGKCADSLGGACSGDYSISIFVSGDCKNTNPKNLCCLKTGDVT